MPVRAINHRPQFMVMIRKIGDHSVSVGAMGNRTDTDMSNMEILALNEFGSPLKNIPPRPVIRPAIEQSRESLAPLVAQAYTAMLQGEDTDTELRLIGQTMVSALRRAFAGPFVPLAANTLQNRRAHGIISTSPLKATMRLYKSIGYRIK